MIASIKDHKIQIAAITAHVLTETASVHYREVIDESKEYYSDWIVTEFARNSENEKGFDDFKKLTHTQAIKQAMKTIEAAL